MTCAEIEELSGAYVLDAVTPEERQAIEEHLTQCSHCTQLIKELRSVVDLLPLSVPQIEPSPGLKDRVLSSIGDRNTQATQQVQPTPQPPRQLRPVQRRSRWQRWGTPLIAAAAVLFFLLTGGLTAWNVSLQQQVNSLSASAPVTYTIEGIAANSSITGDVIYFPQQQVTVITMHGLQQTQGTQVYQGWLIQGKQTISIGLLNTNNGVATIDYPGNIKQFDAAAVSIESGPQATPNAPKGPVLAEGLIKKSA